MSDLTPHYVFEGDQVFAIHEGKVVASGTDMDDVESDATKYLESLAQEREEAQAEDTRSRATHVVTPNGLRGQILGRGPSTWGEQITVRFENGRIETFSSHGAKYEVEESKSEGDPIAQLEARLAAEFEHDKESLSNRRQELDAVAQEAQRLLQRGASYLQERQLAEVHTAAVAEAAEVKEAIDHLDAADAEVFGPPAPFDPQVVEQADIGRGANDNWLDAVVQEIISEGESLDYDKVLNEEPVLLTAELEDPALADTGVTRELALAHIISRTAAFEGKEVEEFRQKFLARVEVARRRELERRQVVAQQRVASEEETLEDVPDEALFT